MLPGFRFLFATVILAASVLVFGLGAAALLRAAHEEFASLAATSQPAPRLVQPHLTPQSEVRPALALLRIETPKLSATPDPIRDTAARPDARPVIVAQDDDAGPEAPPPAMDTDPPADAGAAEGAVAGAPADPAESLEKELNAGATPSDLQTPDTSVPDQQGSGAHATDDNASGGSSSDAGPIAAQPTRMASSHAEEQATVTVTEPVRPAVTLSKRTGARATAQRRLHLARARAAARTRVLQQQQTPDPLAQFFGGGRNTTSDPRS